MHYFALLHIKSHPMISPTWLAVLSSEQGPCRDPRPFRHNMYYVYNYLFVCQNVVTENAFWSVSIWENTEETLSHLCVVPLFTL